MKRSKCKTIGCSVVVNTFDSITSQQLDLNVNLTGTFADEQSKTSGQSLQTYYTTNALSRQAIAPGWEVDTARLQDKNHLSNSGLSELERQGNLGHLTNAKLVPAVGTTQRWNPIALDLGGNLTIKALTGASVQFNVAGKAELDQRLQGTAAAQYLNWTEWLNATDGFLVLDKNVNGTLDNAEELFSNSAVGNIHYQKRSCLRSIYMGYMGKSYQKLLKECSKQKYDSCKTLRIRKKQNLLKLKNSDGFKKISGSGFAINSIAGQQEALS